MRGLPRKPARIAWHGLVLALIFYAAWRFIDFDEFRAALTSVHWPWLVLLLVLATIDRFLMAGKWLQLLRYVKSTATFAAVLSAYYQVGFMQRFIPSSLSGDALRAFHISRQFQGTSGMFATMVVEKLVAMIAAIVLALIGLGLVLTQHFEVEQSWLYILVPVLLLTVMVALRLSLHRPLAEWAIRLTPARIQVPLGRMYDHYESFRQAPQLLAWHFFYCMVEQVVQVLMWLVAALAIGVETPLITLFAALSIAQCIRKFAVILEGWLFGEFTMVLICSMFGIPQSQALAFSILAHACAVIAALPGAFLFSRSAVSLADVRASARQVPKTP
jgi:glycosyltransferase 2 family protein